MLTFHGLCVDLVAAHTHTHTHTHTQKEGERWERREKKREMRQKEKKKERETENKERESTHTQAVMTEPSWLLPLLYACFIYKNLALCCGMFISLVLLINKIWALYCGVWTITKARRERKKKGKKAAVVSDFPNFINIWPSKQQATHDGCFAWQSTCLVISHDWQSIMPQIAHPPAGV